MRLPRNPLIHNAITLMLSEGAWGFQAAMIAPVTFFAVLLAEFGAGKIMIGSIAAVESGGIMVSQILGLLWFHSIRHRKRNLVWWHVGAVIPFLFILALLVYVSPHFPPQWVARLIWLLLAFYMVSIGIVVAVWSEWIASLFATKIRGRVMGLSLCSYAVTGSVGALLAGHLLKDHPEPRVFAFCLFVAGLMALVSMWGYNHVRDPAQERPEQLAVVDFQVIVSKFRQSLRDSNFRYFLGARLLTVLGFSMVPLVAVYYCRPEGGGLNPGTLVSCGASITVGLAAGNLGLGYLGDRRGHRIGLLVGIVCQIVALSVLLILPGLWGCLIFYFFAGISNASGWVSHYNLLFETCPHDHLGAHITIGNLALGGVGLVAPFLAGMIAEGFGLRLLFSISLAISAGALFWLWVLVRDPRSRRKILPDSDGQEAAA
jgi:MFS family permease